MDSPKAETDLSILEHLNIISKTPLWRKTFLTRGRASRIDAVSQACGNWGLPRGSALSSVPRFVAPLPPSPTGAGFGHAIATLVTIGPRRDTENITTKCVLLSADPCRSMLKSIRFVTRINEISIVRSTKSYGSRHRGKTDDPGTVSPHPSLLAVRLLRTIEPTLAQDLSK